MTHEQHITDLVEFILETDCDPRDACGEFPDLLPEVRESLNAVRRVEQQVDILFPPSYPTPDASGRVAHLASNRLPAIRGYELLSILGSGGMGVVYAARHVKLNRIVALKMLRSGPFASPTELERFSREFKAIAEFQHPHIVQIYDVGDAEGRPYFAMELLEGSSLAEQLKGTPQPARHAAETVWKLADAVGSAHASGIIHRDLKPANILLSSDGTPKIGDFGLARHVEDDPAITVSGMLLGTPSYMAPEQALGDCKVIGTAVDIYALGAILYEMLTGRAPFRAESAIETQRQVIGVDPLAPSRINPSVPRDLETICLKCLCKQPEGRYPSAGELADDLQRFLRGEPILARPLARLTRLLRWVKRHPAPSALVLSSLCLIGLSVVLAFQYYAASNQRRAEAEKWAERLAFVITLEEEGRFAEARAILGRIPDGGSSHLRGQIVQAQRDLDLVERLDGIRMSRGRFAAGRGIDYAESSRRYAEAFRQAGVGRVGQDDPAEVASRVRDSTIDLALLAALDDWAACSLAKPREWILEVARRTDPDPWRDQVRDQQQWASIDHLVKLSQVAAIDRQPVTLMVAMGTRWHRLDGDPTAFLERVHRNHPDDFWLNFELGHLHSPHEPQTAIAYNLAALALRPNAVLVHYNLGIEFETLGQIDDAIYHYQRVLQLVPQHVLAEHQLAWMLLRAGRFDESERHFRHLLQVEPTRSQTQEGMRAALLALGKQEEARDLWRSTFDDPTAKHEAVDGYAELCLLLGDGDEYNRACQVLLERFGATQDPLVCERVGRVCLLKPHAEELRLAATKLIDRSLSHELSTENAWAHPYLLFAKALAEYRAGRPKPAISILKGEASTVHQPAPDLVFAMAYNKIGEHRQSRVALDRALASPHFQTDATSREAWMYEILRREAVSLDLSNAASINESPTIKN